VFHCITEQGYEESSQEGKIIIYHGTPSGIRSLASTDCTARSNHCELQDAREAGEDDIEKILAEIMAKEAQKTAVSVTVCSAPPTPRANFTMTSLPSGDLVMFGGEYFDGEDTTCYNDLYRWSVEKSEWRLIESPNSPPPRCSHQAVYYRDHIYIFGGEFATTEQFYHYK
jgi:Galactose oxidase, central domain